MSAPAVAVSRDGKRIAAAWMDERTRKDDRRVYWSAAESMRFTEDAPVDPSSKVRQDHPAITMDGSGTIWIAWEQGEDGSERIRVRSDARDSKPAQASDDAHGSALFPSIAAGGGVIGVAYEAGEDDRKLVAFRRVE
ncbi:MAG TPA: hypothetical protein VMT52_11420 [Planctomycetota bacterium]|nr:hypothetical protein [Planctomycetota bacterium]